MPSPAATEALGRFVEQFKSTVADAFIDSWFIVDQDRTIVEFNRAFFSLLPGQCWRDKHQVRLDEINGRPAQTDQPMRFVLSAIPIFDDAGNPIGALEIQ